MNFKPSQFNIILEQQNNQITLSNTRTGKHIIVSQQEYEKIFNVDKLSDTELKEEYIENKWFIPISLDEASEYINNVYNARTDINTDHLQFTIAPTMACNYRCQYCFEVQSNTICNSFMTDETIDDFLEFVKKQLEIYTKVKYIYIKWFGGEPLLQLEIIEKIIYRLADEILIPRNIGVYQHMYTNGLLMTPEVTDRLVQMHLDSCVISIEGLSPTYAHLKQCKEENFYTVINNIKYAQDKFKILLRTTVTEYNINEIDSLIDYLEEQQLNCEYSLILVDYINGNTKETKVEYDEYMQKLANCNSYIREHCKHLKLLEPIKHEFGYGCEACCSNKCAIDPDGWIYKCNILLGQKQYRVGNIANNKNNKEMENTWIHSKIQDKCKSCVLLPLCMNRCVTNEDMYNIKKSCNIKIENYRYKMKLELNTDHILNS